MQGAGSARNCQGLHITAVAERLLGTKMQMNRGHTENSNAIYGIDKMHTWTGENK